MMQKRNKGTWRRHGPLLRIFQPAQTLPLLRHITVREMMLPVRRPLRCAVLLFCQKGVRKLPSCDAEEIARHSFLHYVWYTDLSPAPAPAAAGGARRRERATNLPSQPPGSPGPTEMRIGKTPTWNTGRLYAAR